MDKLKEKYENAKDLNWYINIMAEDFRGPDKTVKTIPEIKKNTCFNRQLILIPLTR